jgi:hypothetical protein
MSEIIERRVSFSGGEFSEWTDPRLDLEKYRSACRLLENMRPTVYGGAFNRAGMLYVATKRTKNGFDSVGDGRARLVAFEFSVTTNLVLEFGYGYIRFLTGGSNPQNIQVATPSALNLAIPYAIGSYFTSGGNTYYVRTSLVFGAVSPPSGYIVAASLSAAVAFGYVVIQTAYEIPAPYAEEDLDSLQFSQQNDVIYITHPLYQQRVLSRLANNLWTLATFVQEWPAVFDQNTGSTTIAPSGTTGSITLVASTGIFNAGHVGSRWLISNKREDPTVDLDLKASAVNATTSALYVLDAWSLAIKSDSTGTGTWESKVSVERSYDKTTWEPIRSTSSTKTNVQVIITGTEIDPCWLRIKYTVKTGTGQPSRLTAELESISPLHTGIVDITGFTNSTTVTANVVFELGTTLATKFWNEPAWSDYRGWPRSTTLHESRLYFGGNASRPQTVWGSVIDDFTNFRIGSTSDLALFLTISSSSSSGIQWIASNGSLVIGTTGNEWTFGSRVSGITMTPTDTAVKRSTNYGSSHIQPRSIQDALLFVQRGGRKMREFAFSFEKDGFAASDMTLLAEHITNGGIVQLASQKQPETVLWAVTGTGQLIGLVYERGQNVAGWFRYVTDGFIESVTVATGELEEDEVWVCVRRTINSQDVRYIERIQPDINSKLKSGDHQRLVYCDSAKIYEGVPTTTMTGLSHLNGKTVSVLADGSPHAPVPVVAGSITLNRAASVIIAGLPYESTLEPTYLETGDPNSVSKAGKKRITRVMLELWKSLGAEISAKDGSSWSRIEFRTSSDSLDEPLPLFSGIKEESVDGSHERQVTVRIRQTQPLPLNILSLHVRYELNIKP